MLKPKIGKTYIFVRARGNAFEHTEFICHEDSAGFAADGFYHVQEGHPNACNRALQALASLGFRELGEAREAGAVPASWEPRPETFVLKYGPAKVIGEA